MCVLGRWDGTCWSAGSSADIFGVCNTLRRESIMFASLLCALPYTDCCCASANSTHSSMQIRFLSLSVPPPHCHPLYTTARQTRRLGASPHARSYQEAKGMGESLMCTRLYAQSSSYCSLILYIYLARCGSRAET
jgi:hypothetical protein